MGTSVAFVLSCAGLAIVFICVDEVRVRIRMKKYWRCVEKQHRSDTQA